MNETEFYLDATSARCISQAIQFALDMNGCFGYLDMTPHKELFKQVVAELEREIYFMNSVYKASNEMFGFGGKTTVKFYLTRDAIDLLTLIVQQYKKHDPL